MRTFQNAYQMPFSVTIGKTFDKNNKMAFDFAKAWQYPTGHICTEETQIAIVDIINGSELIKLQPLNLEYKDGIIYVITPLNTKAEFIIIRGWGYLTGTGGGLGLLEAEALKIQDDLANYIIEQLNKSFI
jgi:hypothetical protein